MVALAVELGPKDRGPRKPPKDGQVEDEDNLVDNGHPRHGGGAQAAHHHIVQQVYKLGDALLDDHGHQQRQHRGVKGPGADEFFPKAHGLSLSSKFPVQAGLSPAALPSPGKGPPPG